MYDMKEFLTGCLKALVAAATAAICITLVGAAFGAAFGIGRAVDALFK